MSRALDNETVAALQSGDQTAAYAAISGLLTEYAAQSTDRLEIELLGRGHPLPLPSDNGAGAGGGYFLRDGNAVAIHKLALVQAFFVARKFLQKYQSLTSSDDPTAAMAATAVILLFDPEHLTAANTRKRILLARLRDGTQTGILANELCFVDSLLTSHLHRHTKSPTLWSHRRWLVSMDKNTDQNKTLRALTDTVMVAAVRHPRNYYAWDHARWLVAQSRNHDHNTAELLLLPVRDWCYRHHDDTSGWSFLLFLLLRPGMSPTYLDETLAQVEHMAASLQWTGESVWVFLRTAATATASDNQSRFRQTAQMLQRRLDPASQDWRVLQQAQNWRTAYPTASVRRGSC